MATQEEYKCEISLPKKIVSLLGLSQKELGTALKKELAVHFFENNLLSFGQARQMAEMPVWEFITFLKDRKVPLHYDILEYEEDSQTIKKLMKT